MKQIDMIKRGYLILLATDQRSHQWLLVNMRETIAEADGVSSQATQDNYESIAGEIRRGRRAGDQIGLEQAVTALDGMQADDREWS